MVRAPPRCRCSGWSGGTKSPARPARALRHDEIGMALSTRWVGSGGGIRRHPLPGVEVRLVTREAARTPGAPARSRCAARRCFSILRRPDATAAAFRDGWFRTGRRRRRGTRRVPDPRPLECGHHQDGGYKVSALEVGGGAADDRRSRSVPWWAWRIRVGRAICAAVERRGEVDLTLAALQAWAKEVWRPNRFRARSLGCRLCAQRMGKARGGGGELFILECQGAVKVGLIFLWPPRRPACSLLRERSDPVAAASSLHSTSEATLTSVRHAPVRAVLVLALCGSYSALWRQDSRSASIHTRRWINHRSPPLGGGACDFLEGLRRWLRAIGIAERGGAQLDYPGARPSAPACAPAPL